MNSDSVSYDDDDIVPHGWILAMVICCGIGFLVEILILIDIFYRFCISEQDKEIDSRIKNTTFGMDKIN